MRNYLIIYKCTYFICHFPIHVCERVCVCVCVRARACMCVLAEYEKIPTNGVNIREYNA